ncbi:MAG: hypothetical protein JW778_06535 [Candidatus Altiarchaeota archaeon]|nr:hypothetical protein [Candidatus Altiarchaeota archaeon]
MQRLLVLFFITLFLCGCVQQDNGSDVSTTTSTTLECNESDAGRDYLVKGAVSGYSKDNESLTEADYCLNSDQLIELFCDEVGFVDSEVVSCKRMDKICSAGICVKVTSTTSTSTTSTSTSSTTTTTLLGECVTGGCGESSVSYRCASDLDASGNLFNYVQKVTVIPYCADPGTLEAKCKVRERLSIEDRCENYEVCVDGLQDCQLQSAMNSS